MATVELAAAIPALLLVLALGLSAVRLGIEQVRCIDGARAGVRLLARGESTGRAVAEARRLAPGARVSAGVGGSQVSLRVVGRAPPLLSWVAAPSATARAVREASLDGLP